jgi:hypothetical protein
LSAVYLYFVFYSGALVTESLYLVAILWVLDLVTAIAYQGEPERDPRAIRTWVLLGLACGASVLLRQVFLLMVPLVLVWLVWQLARTKAQGLGLSALTARAGIVLLVIGGCTLPWTVRNYIVFGEIVPLNTNAGFAFFWGNHPIHGTNFIPILPDDPNVNYGTLIPRELRTLNEAQLDQALLIRGWGFVRDEPWRYARLSISRGQEYFKFWPSPESSALSNVARVLSFGALVPLLLCGFVLTFAMVWRGETGHHFPAAALLVLVATLYSLVHLLSWTLVRYRLPVDAMTMPFAAVALVALFERMGNLRPSKLPVRVPAG